MEKWKQFAPPIVCEQGSPFRVINESYRFIRKGRGFFDHKRITGSLIQGARHFQ